MEIEHWSDFAVAVAGASAALTGLVFVAVSINLPRILAYQGLPARTGQTLAMFLTPLFLAVFMLTRGQPVAALGVELIATGLVAGAVLGWLSRPRGGEEEPAISLVLARIVPSALIAGGAVAAGVSLLAGAGGGLLWTVPAVLGAFLGGVGNAWVLLIEIQR